MDSFFTVGKKRNYDDFRKQITRENLPLADTIREFCLSLGKNVVEDVRMHRVVYCKSISFRWFVDVEPQENGFILKIQTDRKLPQQIISIKNLDEFSSIREIIKNAYNTIR